MINSRFYKTLIKTSPKLSNEQLNYKKYYKNVEENKIKEGKQCPYCKGEKIIKFGFFNGHQRFRCKNELCKKTFTGNINNPFRYSKKFRENYEKYFEFFIQGLPLRICAAKTGITLVTAFFWRHRFLHDLVRKNYKEKISGPYIELTQFVTLENFKGDRKFHEEKRDKIIVINALNDKIEILPIMGGRKFFGANQLRDNLIPRLDKKAYTVGFINGRLKNFCRALNVVNKVKINKEDQDKLLKEYSHGMKNKMQMLINFIANPKVLLLDEPLTSLDVVVQEEMKQLLKNMKKGHILIFSTHILEIALDLCDEIVILNNKKLELIEKNHLNTKKYKDKIIENLKDEKND